LRADFQADADFNYPAALYEAVHHGNAGDMAFYQDACAGARVLELGCGSGRIGASLAATGTDVIGLDRNFDALRLANSRGLRCVAADMRHFRLRRRFQRIIIPYCGLYCLLNDDDVVACLINARRHLMPGGQIIFDGYAVDESALAVLGKARRTPREKVAEVHVEGRWWDVSESTIAWPESQRIDATYEHVPRGGGRCIKATVRQRYLLSFELPDVLARAGLMLVALHGDFEGDAYGPMSEHLVVRAERWR